jgi:NhaP-type Na+/H+ or K+/H+ antiporter
MRLTRGFVMAMPITAGLVALVTHSVTDLGWTESFLVGALLSPTDPVLSSSVSTRLRRGRCHARWSISSSTSSPSRNRMRSAR